MIDKNFDQHFVTGNTYTSPPRTAGIVARYAPNFAFYTRAILGPVSYLCFLAQIGKSDDTAWALGSARVARCFESIGARFEITGMDNLQTVDKPCIFVANHMSTLETFVLPSMLRPHTPVTFVVKRSLTTMPIFGSLLRSRNPVVLDRKNAREDFKVVLEEGKKRLEEGISLVIFPQSTRTQTFDAAKFNSIGIKLAKHCQRPIVPIALKTNTWEKGTLMKDFGPVFPHRTIHFAFGKPLYIEGQGKTEHTQICDFIGTHIAQWTAKDTNTAIPE